MSIIVSKKTFFRVSGKNIFSLFTLLHATFVLFLSKIIRMMKTFLKFSAVFLTVFLTSVFAVSCSNKLDNQIDIKTHIDFTINPYSLQYQELSFTGGWMYLTGIGDSYGIIVYRVNDMDFMAYDRKPFYNSSCPDNRLDVDGLFIKDKCNGYDYSILTGMNMNGDGTHPYWYYTEYDGGSMLHIHN